MLQVVNWLALRSLVSVLFCSHNFTAPPLKCEIIYQKLKNDIIVVNIGRLNSPQYYKCLEALRVYSHSPSVLPQG